METLSLLGVALGFAYIIWNQPLPDHVSGPGWRYALIGFSWQTNTKASPYLPTRGLLVLLVYYILLEFFADKIPWVDSSWDAVHTFIRPIGGTLLALAALGEMDPVVSVIAGLLGGGTTLITHATKAGSRLLINMSPEPVSNTIASVGEDGLVLGGLGLMAFAPVVAFFVFLAVVILAVWLSRKTWGTIRRGWTALKQRRSEGT